jgi:hypothetical protein
LVKDKNKMYPKIDYSVFFDVLKNTRGEINLKYIEKTIVTSLLITIFHGINEESVETLTQVSIKEKIKAYLIKVKDLYKKNICNECKIKDHCDLDKTIEVHYEYNGEDYEFTAKCKNNLGDLKVDT